MAGDRDHVLLRRYADAHEAGDRERAAELWKELAVGNFDRVQQIVKAFRFSPGGQGLPELEWGSAASEAYLRVVAMGASFRGREPGQFYAALVTCVRHACMDYGRKELRHELRAAGSIDETYDAGGDAGPYDAALAAHEAELRTRRADAEQAERSAREADDLVAWGIAGVENPAYREVLRLTYVERLSGDEIAARLDISRDNAYQRRRRGILELERILRGDRA
jgi:RNA polymerase sigma factor (sigma-70 family)